MKNERVPAGAPEPTRSTLALDIFSAWLASQMGVSLSTAQRHAQETESELGSLWLHVADYVWLLNTGYAPVDLKSLNAPDSQVSLNKSPVQ